ncbi:stalk domain-containing protein [Zhaonella formicivorans]|uniref:stalk domain-containing protein n=1 Tax=Zhaonella formicivorans TaxID=2528593 RepID=UPI0010E86295|nr:stalk domain-containing protein [Zhaonella formicivorans]
MKKVLTVVLLIALLVSVTPVWAKAEKVSKTTKDSEWFVGQIETLEEAKKIANERMGKLTVPHWIQKYDEIGNGYVEETTREVENVVFILKGQNKYLVEDVGAWTLFTDSPYFESEIKAKLFDVAFDMVLSYPEIELVSINDTPWQETEYKDYFVSEVKRLIREGAGSAFSMLRNKDPYAWQVFLNPKYNGRAYEIFNPKTREEQESAVKILSELEVLDPSYSLPDKRPSDGNISAQAVLKLNDNKVVIVKNGATEKVNRLAVRLQAPKGVTMVPLRGVLDELGADLSYDGRNKQVIIKQGNSEIVLKENSRTAKINGQAKEIVASMQIQNGRAMIPLRLVSDALGYTTVFNSMTGEITVTK